MDKLLAKLKEANISEEELNSLKEEFEAQVKARVDEESDRISEKADEYCRQKISSAIALKEKQLTEKANEYCAKKAATIARKADRKIALQIEKLQKASQEYTTKFFNEKFQEKFGQELQNIEEKVIVALDKYLDYAIAENISPALITKTAINETFAPIVKGIQNLFEEQYVPLNVSGTKKLKEANRRVAELEATLKEQLNDNIRLSETAEKAAKQALIAEKTCNMTDKQKEKVKKFFESKSYSSVKDDIDTYCSIITENVEMKRATAPTMVNEKASVKAKRRRPIVDDSIPDFVTEKFKPMNESSEIDDFLLRSNQFLENSL